MAFRITPSLFLARRRRSFTVMVALLTITIFYLFVLPLQTYPHVSDLSHYRVTNPFHPPSDPSQPTATPEEEQTQVQDPEDPADSTDADFDGLSLKDFPTFFPHTYKSHPLAGRFSAKDAWRPLDSYDVDSLRIDALRPDAPKLGRYANKAEYLRQSLVADYAPNATSLFVMMKEGANVLWNRVPVHLLTTFTRVPYFALYADIGGSIAGHEVVNVLENVTETTKKSKDFALYRDLEKVRDTNVVLDPGELKISGGWALDKFKNVPMLYHAYLNAPASVDWFAFMDGDTYFFWDNLVDYLKTLDPLEPVYLGSPTAFRGVSFGHGGSGVVISRKALDMTLGAHPDWVTDLETETSKSCCGDYMVGYMLKRSNISLAKNAVHNIGKKFQGESLWGIDASENTWCQKIVSFHHLSPQDVELLWEYERMIGPERRSNISYSDIYRDFVLPYIAETLPDWNNYAKDRTYSEKNDQKDAEKKRKKEAEKKKKDAELKEAEEKKKAAAGKVKRDALPEDPKTDQQQLKKEEPKKEEPKKEEPKKEDPKKEEPKKEEPKKEPRPWHSRALCEAECEKWKQCLSWRYFPALKLCGLGKSVKLGRPTLDFVRQKFESNNKGDYENAVSGWRLDRIRAMRKKQPCDIIYGDETQADDKAYAAAVQEGSVQDSLEGWFRRQQEREKKA